MTRFYVTLTWHDWPEGGSYGTIVEAKDHEEAEKMARAEMAESYSATINSTVEYAQRAYGHNWHIVDCFDLDAFIEANPRKTEDVWADDPDHPRELWQYEVGNGETTLGYWDWVQHQREASSDT